MWLCESNFLNYERVFSFMFSIFLYMKAIEMPISSLKVNHYVFILHLLFLLFFSIKNYFHLYKNEKFLQKHLTYMARCLIYLMMHNLRIANYCLKQSHLLNDFKTIRDCFISFSSFIKVFKFCLDRIFARIPVKLQMFLF